jgi:hypothetical protein
MSIAAKIRRAPLRAAAGAFILNSGITKFGGDDDAAKGTHSMAVGAYPFLERIPPKPFFRGLATAETALGAALLAPLVPAGVAAMGLVGFSGALLGMWWRTPGMHMEGSPRPTRHGTPLAKDVWMFGIGTSLLVDAALTESPITNDDARARARASVKAEAKAARKGAQRVARRARKRADSLLPS